jgi:hypothetical protein
MFMQYSEYGVLSRLQVVFHLSCSDEEIYVTYRRTSSHLNDTRINLRWSTPVNFVSVVSTIRLIVEPYESEYSGVVYSEYYLDITLRI